MYQGNLQNVEKGHTNRSFKTATLRLLAVDVVANKTKYSKESILKALPTLRNIPIVGLLKGDDFGSHEAQMVLDEEVGLKTVYNTVPFGLIPESANFWFETANVNGKEQKFLCVDVLLWKRQKEVNVLAKRKQFNTSMEVTILSGNKDRTGVLHIDDFYFTAVCVLGNHIAPAFKGAQIQTYSEDTDVQDKINQMMMEFAEQLGGETMSVEETILTPEEQDVQAPVVEEVETPTEETPEETPVVEEPETPEAGEGEYQEETPVVEEPEATEPEVEEPKTEGESTEETPETDTPVAEEAPAPTLEETYETLKVEHQGLVDSLMAKNQEMTDLQTAYETLKADYEDLKAFKDEVLAERRREAEEQLFNKFKDLEETPEFDQLKSTAKDYSIEELETQLYALMGRKFYAEQKPATKPTVTHVAYEATYQASTPTDSVFGLLDSYLKK